ncbi:hypothetical protein BH11MYX1_BH11MYX1_39100 [soil metagenome]
MQTSNGVDLRLETERLTRRAWTAGQLRQPTTLAQQLGRFELFAAALSGFLGRYAGHQELDLALPAGVVRIDVSEHHSLQTLVRTLASGVAPPDAVCHVRAAEIVGRGDHDLDVVLEADAVVWTYNAEVFLRAAIERIAGNFEFFLSQATAAPEVPVATFSLVEPAQALALRAWNKTTRVLPDTSVDELIAEQAAQTPDKIAIEFEGVRLTYAELERRAEAFAAVIEACALPDNSIVGVLMERSLESVTAFLGIIKSGHCFLPLDPNYPEARVHFMIEDAATPLIVTQASLAHRVPRGSRSLVFSAATVAVPRPSRPRLDPGRRCYVIYTSGSTGVPKGVQITHRGLVNLLLTELIAHAPDECFSCVTTFSFDIVWYELLCPLIRGGRVSLVTHEAGHDGELLRELIRSTGVTVLFATPSRFRMLLDAGLCADDGVKVILCGGEAFPADLARALQACAGEVWNVYGPTEVTILSAAYRCELIGPGPTVPIGKPTANTSLYILDRHRNQLPIGVIGELYIGGAQVAIGYLEREQLTAERFVVVDGIEPAPVRVYRTGDLCYRRSDGNVEYVARADNQIKLRGFRIELGEIEAAVRAYPGVGDAVVIVTDGVAGQTLVAYVAAQELDVDGIRAALVDRLPPYMVPSHFVVLPALPLGPSGKIDRAALPAPRILASEASTFDNETQRRLAVLWSELLLIGVGPHDEFRQLGGNSLLMARLAARIRREWTTTISLRKLTEAQTVATMATLLDASMLQQPAAAERAPLAGTNQSVAQRWRRYRGALAVGLALAATVAIVTRGALVLASCFVLPVPESDPVSRLSYEEGIGHFSTAVREPEPTAIVLGSSDVSQGFSPLEFDGVFAQRGQRLVTYSYGFQGSSPETLRNLALALRSRFEAAGKRTKLAVLSIDPQQLLSTEGDEKWGDWQSTYVATPPLLWQLARRHPLDAVALGLSRVFVGEHWRYSIWSGIFARISAQPAWWFGTRVELDEAAWKSELRQERLSQVVWNPALRGNFDVGATIDPEAYKLFVAERQAPKRRRRLLEAGYRTPAGEVNEDRLATLFETARDLAAVSDRVVLLSMPVNPYIGTHASESYEQLLGRVRAAAVGDVIDMRFDPRFTADDFINIAHLTYPGAQKFSKYLAEQLAPPR